MDENFYRYERVEQKLSRRSSILKELNPRDIPEHCEDDEKTGTVSNRRSLKRVSFADTTSIKEFLATRDAVTEWNRTYEEPVDYEASSSEEVPRSVSEPVLEKVKSSSAGALSTTWPANPISDLEMKNQKHNIEEGGMSHFLMEFLDSENPFLKGVTKKVLREDCICNHKIPKITSEDLDLTCKPNQEITRIVSEDMDITCKLSQAIARIPSEDMAFITKPIQEINGTASEDMDFTCKPYQEIKKIMCKDMDLISTPNLEITKIASEGIDVACKPDHESKKLMSKDMDFISKSNPEITIIRSEDMDFTCKPNQEITKMTTEDVDFTCKLNQEITKMTSEDMDFTWKLNQEITKMTSEDMDFTWKLNQEITKMTSEDMDFTCKLNQEITKMTSEDMDFTCKLNQDITKMTSEDMAFTCRRYLETKIISSHDMGFACKPHQGTEDRNFACSSHQEKKIAEANDNLVPQENKDTRMNTSSEKEINIDDENLEFTLCGISGERSIRTDDTNISCKCLKEVSVNRGSEEMMDGSSGCNDTLSRPSSKTFSIQKSDFQESDGISIQQERIQELQLFYDADIPPHKKRKPGGLSTGYQNDTLGGTSEKAKCGDGTLESDVPWENSILKEGRVALSGINDSAPLDDNIDRSAESGSFGSPLNSPLENYTLENDVTCSYSRNSTSLLAPLDGLLTAPITNRKNPNINVSLVCEELPPCSSAISGPILGSAKEMRFSCDLRPLLSSGESAIKVIPILRKRPSDSSYPEEPQTKIPALGCKNEAFPEIPLDEAFMSSRINYIQNRLSCLQPAVHVAPIGKNMLANSEETLHLYLSALNLWHDPIPVSTICSEAVAENIMEENVVEDMIKNIDSIFNMSKMKTRKTCLILNQDTELNSLMNQKCQICSFDGDEIETKLKFRFEKVRFEGGRLAIRPKGRSLTLYFDLTEFNNHMKIVKVNWRPQLEDMREPSASIAFKLLSRHIADTLDSFLTLTFCSCMHSLEEMVRAFDRLFALACELKVVRSLYVTNLEGNCLDVTLANPKVRIMVNLKFKLSAAKEWAEPAIEVTPQLLIGDVSAPLLREMAARASKEHKSILLIVKEINSFIAHQ